MSIIEEATYSTVVPMMGVFNNLVMYKQDEPQNSMKSIVPDLATSWSWSEDGTELTFKLRQGVKWHDGKPFTAADVKCTYDLLLGKAKEKLRINPRKAWFRNLEEVTANSDGEVDLSSAAAATGVHRLARLRLFADLPLPRVAARHAHPPDRHRALQIRRVQSERVDPGRRAIRITGNRAGPISTASSTRSSRTGRPRILAFVAGKLDMTWPYIITVPLLKDIKTQAPQAICELKTHERQHQSARQPRCGAVRQCRICGGRWRWHWTAKPSSRS